MRSAYWHRRRDTPKAPNDSALAARAAKPIAPIVYALGNVPWSVCHIAVPIIQSPNRPMVVPLANAAMAR